MPTKPDPLARLKQQLAQLDQLVAEGVLTGEAARQSRDQLERQLVAAVMGNADAGAVPAAAAPRPSRRLLLGSSVFVLVLAIAGYAWLGNREGWNAGPGSGAQAEGGDAAAHSTQAAQIEAMIAKLAARLKEKPDDAEGWSMLARSYNAQGKHAEALPAFKRVMELRPNDAQAIVDYADSLAMANNRSLEGEPTALIDKALKLDPKNVKALALSGTVAFMRNDFKLAAARWEQAVAGSEPNSDFTRQLQGALNEARERAGLPALAGAEAPAAQPAPAAPAAATGPAQVSGRISLDPKLKAQVGPDDTLFIFARAPSGSKMPLAILRKKAGELPLDFRLDDSMAMSPQAKLSSLAQVVIGARISKSGNAVPVPGDLQVLSAPVNVGSQGIQLQITEVVR